MKLKLIENRKRRTPQFSGIHMYRNGALSIYEKAVDKIGLKAGDNIAIIQDLNNADDFYITKIDNPNMPLLRQKNEKNKILVTGYAEAYHTMIDHFKLDKISLKIPIGGAIKTEYGTTWVLITSAIKDLRKEVING